MKKCPWPLIVPVCHRFTIMQTRSNTLDWSRHFELGTIVTSDTNSIQLPGVYILRCIGKTW